MKTMFSSEVSAQILSSFTLLALLMLQSGGEGKRLDLHKGTNQLTHWSPTEEPGLLRDTVLEDNCEPVQRNGEWALFSSLLFFLEG